jgi:hypothetical protein
MRTMRNSYYTFLLLAGAMVLPTGSASAQIMPGMDTPLQKEPKKLTPEQQKYQDALDENYKAAQKKIPLQKPKDPWADIRQAPTASTPKTKQQ